MNGELGNSRICVAGIGGVGGFIGGALAKVYPHVSFYARGARKESIQNNGLVVKSEYMGDYEVRPEKVTDQADELGIMDYIFICVKNYSLEQVCNQISPMVSENTVIIPIMNGIDAAERTREYLNKGKVLNALIYIVSGSREDFTIVQKGNYTTVHIGLKNPSEEEKSIINNVFELLNGADVKCVMDDDIEAVIWKKYILNCAFNIVTANYSANTGEIRKDPRKIEEFHSLLSEAYLVGKNAGINLEENVVEEHLNHMLHVQAEDATSSLRRDMDLNKTNEIETFSGCLLRLGKQYGLNLPVTESFYNQLKDR